MKKIPFCSLIILSGILSSCLVNFDVPITRIDSSFDEDSKDFSEENPADIISDLKDLDLETDSGFDEDSKDFSEENPAEENPADATSDLEDLDLETELEDPCALPTIPSTGLYVFYCLNEDRTTDMTLWRSVDQPGPDIEWGIEPGCATTDTISLFCNMDTSEYGTGRKTIKFKIEIPGIGIGWSCGPGLEVNHGNPRLFYNNHERTLEIVDDGDGGCYHQSSIL